MPQLAYNLRALRNPHSIFRLAISALLLGAGALGCSAEAHDPTAHPASIEEPGSLQLNLTPLSGLTVDTLNYVITRDGIAAPIRQGILPTQGSGSSFRIGLSLPVGTGYRLSLSGVAVENPVRFYCTAAAGPFSVFLGSTPLIDAELECLDLAFGTVGAGLGIVTEGCPEITFDQVTALPAITTVASSLLLRGTATGAAGSTISYLWTVGEPVASLATPAQSETALTCLEPAEDIVVTLTAFNGQCSKTTDVLVSCTAP